uniref:Immunoglobulin I-set domain-containing protein n=1 Tax=Pygocentrus nattereri TaxID=42514 RepID=A0A3B4DKN2_PYGNA
NEFMKPCIVLVLLLFCEVPQGGQCVSVRFPSQQPVYVINGENLILQAQIDWSLGESISKVTWAHEAEGTKNSGKTVVAEFPFKSSGGRVTVEKDGAVMKLSNYQRTDSGAYTITVSNQHGDQASARCSVHEYGTWNQAP